MATYELADVIAKINAAVSEKIIPEDITRLLRESREVFRNQDALFGQNGLSGEQKYAELVLKLGYWLAIRQLTPEGFITLEKRIPHDYNESWEVEEPGYSNMMGGADKSLGPVLNSGGHHNEGSDKVYFGELYLSNGRETGGGSIRLMPVTSPSVPMNVPSPQKNGCLLALVFAPFTLICKLIERL